jgi:cell wall assembly regulator SMI1
MLTLTEAYLRVLQWAASNFAESQNAFLPKLTPQKIDEISSNLEFGYPYDVKVGLPFQIPSDVREIYQLNNGQKSYTDDYYTGGVRAIPENQNEYLCIFDGKTLLPLQSAIARDISNFNPNWLMLFTREDEDYLVMDTSNGYLLDFNHSCGDESDTFVVYSSLANMMRTHAEFYESGGNIDGVISFSEEYQQIWLKYNSEIGEQAIKTVLSNRG